MPILEGSLLLVAVMSGLPALSSQAEVSACSIAADPTYGFTPDNPVQIGGGAMYVKAREARYLNALRGPKGEPVRYRRAGAVPVPPNGLTILDQYEVTYDGLQKPLMLYLDAYHYWEQSAPKGFTCGQPIELQPMLDEFQALETLQAVAFEQARTQSFAPIPLAPEGGTTRGVILDAFRMIALSAGAAARQGGAPEHSANVPSGTLVVAHPVSCTEGTVGPVDIELLAADGRSHARISELMKDSELSALVPGATAPHGSVAALFALPHPGAGDRIRIRYAGSACGDKGSDLLFPVVFTPARGISMPDAPLPQGAAPGERRILMQALIDVQGAFKQASYAGGPAGLEAAAREALAAWRAEPARVNGAPVPSSTLIEVRFK